MLQLITELGRLRRSQWMTSDDLGVLQLRKLQRVVAHAYESAPFYHDLMTRSGFEPSDVRTMDDLVKLPIVTKSALQNAGDAAYARSIDRSHCVWMKTSGSDGSPLSLPFTRYDKAHRVLKELRQLESNGWTPAQRMFLLVEPRCVRSKKAVFQHVGILRRDYMSIFEDVSAQIDYLIRKRPSVVYGYTSSLCILGDEIGRRAVSVRPKLLVTSAELLDQMMRQRLQKSFGVSPTDFYGSMEFGWVAWQCPEKGSYHVNSDCLVVECIKDGRSAGPDEEGEIVVTNLHSDAAPLIRYATGDIGHISHGQCRCGRGLPLLDSIRGRMVDSIIHPAGRAISPYVLTCAVEDVPGVKRFQIVQEGSGRIVVFWTPGMGWGDGTSAAIRDSMRGVVGSEVDINVLQIEDIPREPSGKFKVVRSYLARENAMHGPVRPPV